jgi:hypothetical protein
MTLALEINDAGLVLVRDGELLAEEPGCAMLDGSEPQTGSAAAREASCAYAISACVVAAGIGRGSGTVPSSCQ